MYEEISVYIVYINNKVYVGCDGARITSYSADYLADFKRFLQLKLPFLGSPKAKSEKKKNILSVSVLVWTRSQFIRNKHLLLMCFCNVRH